MEIPTNLKHKPVIVVEDYDKVDGRNALNTDARITNHTYFRFSDLSCARKFILPRCLSL